MGKAILLCGKIASGKSVYAAKLLKERRAVLLSVDEITIDILGGDLGDRHDEIAVRTQCFLFQKSLEILHAGVDVILDWGFWTKKNRDSARAYYDSCGITCEIHFIDTPDEVWRRNIELRNRAVAAGEVNAYSVDEGLLRKLNDAFEMPDRSEIDVWYENAWFK